MMALLLVVLAALTAVLQVSLPWAWWPLDLCLLLAAFAGLTRGSGWGLVCGLVAGTCLDLLISPALGLRMVPLGLAGALADALQPGVNRDQPRLQVAAVLCMVLLHDALLALMGRRFDLPQSGLTKVFFAYVAPRLAGQGLATVPFFLALSVLVRQKVFLDPRHRGVQTIRRWG